MNTQQLEHLAELSKEIAENIGTEVAEAVCYAAYHAKAGRHHLAEAHLASMGDKTPLYDLLHRQKCDGCGACADLEEGGYVQRPIRL